jgi:murein L,D-transpeptidase YcbB/YkuD
MSPDASAFPCAATRRGALILGLGGLALAACGRRAAAQGSVGQQLTDPVARRFYADRGFQPAWSGGAVRSLTDAIAGASAQGLNPTVFAPKAAAGGAPTDEALTLAALGYAKALAVGLVDPHQIEPIYTVERNSVDLAAGLGQALQRGDVGGWLASLPPADAEYKALCAAFAAASASPAQARQLAVNLERRRWLARNPPEHRIDANTAAAFLGYFKPGQPVWATRTVVGRADHQTPSIQPAFHALVANPPWRVPMDIAKKEILPKGAAYMRREDMRIVDGLVEQAAGPKSALGQVKFDVEDPYDIYLHDTPAKSLFALPERHRSHGCVRVQHAVAFARNIAAETGKGDAFDQALASKDTRSVELGQSIAVRTLYHTAYLGPDQAVLLGADVYGFDDKVAAALGLGQGAAGVAANGPDVDLGP